jgi:hypothetical protein
LLFFSFVFSSENTLGKFLFPLRIYPFENSKIFKISPVGIPNFSLKNEYKNIIIKHIIIISSKNFSFISPDVLPKKITKYINI